MSAKDPTATAGERAAEAEPQQDLAAAIHETTNMMTVVLGWLARARDTATEQATIDAIEHAVSYTRSSRDTMRRAIGAEVPGAPPAPVGQVVARTVEDLAVAAGDADVMVSAQIDGSISALAIVQPDVAWQILTNLVLNGIAVTSEGGSVTVQVTATDGELVLRVLDEGPGVPDSVRTTLFTGQSRRRGGAGIGLRHSRALAESSGGSLKLIEDNSDGACFELRWPRADEALTPDAKASSRPRTPPTRSLAATRVLLLEDDPAVVELLELSLTARGADLTVVGEAGALYKALDGDRFDAVLVDLSPLEGALDEACNQARANNPDINIVVISGSVTVQPREDVVWVRKPFEPRELVRAIARSWQND